MEMQDNAILPLFRLLIKTPPRTGSLAFVSSSASFAPNPVPVAVIMFSPYQQQQHDFSLSEQRETRHFPPPPLPQKTPKKIKKKKKKKRKFLYRVFQFSRFLSKHERRFYRNTVPSLFTDHFFVVVVIHPPRHGNLSKMQPTNHRHIRRRSIRNQIRMNFFRPSLRPIEEIESVFCFSFYVPKVAQLAANPCSRVTRQGGWMRRRAILDNSPSHHQRAQVGKGAISAIQLRVTNL